LAITAPRRIARPEANRSTPIPTTDSRASPVIGNELCVALDSVTGSDAATGSEIETKLLPPLSEATSAPLDSVPLPAPDTGDVAVGFDEPPLPPFEEEEGFDDPVDSGCVTSVLTDGGVEDDDVVVVGDVRLAVAAVASVCCWLPSNVDWT